MPKLLFAISFLCVSLAAQSQINTYQKDYSNSFKKDFKFDSLQIPSPFEVTVPKLKTPEGILKNNHFAQDIAVRVYRPAMPIQHPELEGYRMPIHEPNPAMDYSLLIVPILVVPPIEGSQEE